MRRVRHPILRLEVLAGDGTAATSHAVFCRLQRSSVDVDGCSACVHCTAIVTEPSSSVVCTIAVPEGMLAPDPDGIRVEVGTLLCTGMTRTPLLEPSSGKVPRLTLEERTPVRIALRLLASSHLREAPVVRRDGSLLGVFRDVDGLRWMARAREGVVDDAVERDPEDPG